MKEKTKHYFQSTFRIISGVMFASDYDLYVMDRNKKYGNRGWLLTSEIHPMDDQLRIVYVYPVEGEYLSKVATDVKTIKLADIL